MLTPVRVRGRRTRQKPKRQSSDDDPGESPSSQDSQSSTKSKRRARLKPFDQLIDYQEKTLAHRKALLAAAAAAPKRKKRAGLSLLERLPVELIEKIFLYSLELNLPRASARIGAAVSNSRVYRELILLAFYGEEDGPVREPECRAAISKAFRLAEYGPLGERERTRLQAAVLNCRWCTRDRIQAQLPELMRMMVFQQWFDRRIGMSGEEKSELERLLSRNAVQRSGTDGYTFEGTSTDQHVYLTIVPLVSVTYATDFERKTYGVLSLRSLPGRLLRGGNDGFRPDDLDLLEIFRVQAGLQHPRRLNTPLLEYSREALQEGIHNALVSRNERALTILLKLDEMLVRSHVTETGELPYSLPAEHFRTAVHHSPDDPRFFQLLLRAHAESVPPDDPDITQWAMDLQSSPAQGSRALGGWLLDFMVELTADVVERARKDPQRAALFYQGGINLEHKMGRSYAELAGGTRSLSRWMHETDYDVSRQWIPA
ncbi:hypothetical protein VTN31DRAFT_29 [Thermomyces dupontii]|uniref:uncharacterized protein n=1 Tax=Talaromyces thermophilus TaxID=28565 RepID=UPI003743E6AF